VQSEYLATGWHRVASGNVRLLTDRCGIYFDMQDVDGSNSPLIVDDGTTLALMDVSAVRVTAIVKSDERVAYDAQREESAGTSAEIARVLRDEGCRWVKRHSTSAFASEGTGVVHDDSGDVGPMKALAVKARRETEALGSRVDLSLPWVDLSTRVGDRIAEIEGRGIALIRRPGAEPEPAQVGRVTYDFREQRTDLELVAVE